MCLGVPGKIVEIRQTAGLRMGRIDFGGVHREVCLAYVPEAQVGDYAVIHAGFAISRLSAEEAEASLAAIREIVNLQDELGPNAEGT